MCGIRSSKMSDNGHNDLEWAGALVGQWVVQVPSRVVGRVKALSALNNGSPILIFEQGHSFHAVRENFLRVEERDFRAYEQMVAAIALVTKELAVLGKSAGMSQQTFEALCGVAFAGQLMALTRRP